MGNRIEVRKKM